MAKEETKLQGLYVRLLVIRTNSGIKDKLATAEDEHDFDHTFTSKLLEYLLYEECVEYRFSGRRKDWRITYKGLQKRRIDAEKQEGDLDAYIYGLTETILDAMAELGGTEDYIRLREIANKCGFEDKLPRVESMPQYNNFFTHTLLYYLLGEMRVEKSLELPGCWKIADEELQKHRA